MTRQKLHGWTARTEMHGRIVLLTVAANSPDEACEGLRLICRQEIDPVNVCETTTILRQDEPKEMQGYLAVPVDWREE